MYRCLILLAMASPALAAPATQPDADTPAPCVSLELTDGARLAGTARLATVRLIAPYGRLEVRFDQISVIEFNADRERARLKMGNGDVLSGVLDLGEIVLETPGGERTVATVKLARLMRIPPEVAQIEPWLVHGRVQGERTDFVKDLPEEVACKLTKETRTLNTFSSSVAERHVQAPWLYPIAGKGEIPRVLRETGRICYPIWGTWRQRWADGWAYNDENEHPCKGPKPRYPHHETAVDYYVVPLAGGGGD